MRALARPWTAHYLVARTRVITGARLTRAVVAAAGALLAALVLLNVLRPLRPEVLTAAGWTLTAVVRTAGLALAWSLSADARRRRAWGWLTVGSVLDLSGQVYADLVILRGGELGSLSAADIGSLAVYPAFFLAAWNLIARPPLRQFTTEILLDSTLLTLTAVAWAYKLYVEPFGGGAAPIAVLASVAYATGGLALIWLIGMLLLRPNRFPSGGEGLAVAGLVLYALSDLVFGTVALPSGAVAGTLLDFGWNVSNLVLGTAGALAAARPTSGRPNRWDAPAWRRGYSPCWWASRDSWRSTCGAC
jgi:hypothetical protein